MKLLALLFITACASEPPTPLPPEEPQMTITGIVDPITKLPACARLATDDACCRAACEGGSAFRSQCAIAGECASYVCPLQGGGSFEAEVCEP